MSGLNTEMEQALRQMCVFYIYIYSFSRCFYPKRQMRTLEAVKPTVGMTTIVSALDTMKNRKEKVLILQGQVLVLSKKIRLQLFLESGY